MSDIDRGRDFGRRRRGVPNKCLGKILFEIENQSNILKIMSYEELKKK
jgi:hypothetical protein